MTSAAATQAFGRLDDAAWERVIVRATSYAWLLVRRSRGLSKGNEAEDLVQDAIQRTLSGVRVWKPDPSAPVDELEENLVLHLLGAVRSLASAMVTSPDRTRRVQTGGSGADTPIAPQFPGATGQEAQQEMEAREQLARLREEARKEPPLDRILDALVEGLRPGEIAARLEIGATDVYTLTRKLRRRLVSAGLYPVTVQEEGGHS